MVWLNDMKNFVASAFIVLAVIATGIFTGFIGIRYPRVVENQPLRSPVRVVAVDGSRITLGDGVVVELDDSPMKGTWSSTMSDTHHWIDVESSGGDEVLIFGNRKGWICGTPWAQPIRIPLIPVDVYRNRREVIGFGTRLSSSTPAQPVAPNP
ncbi:MAG: hypothetical protein V4819_18730 [Verrucomicrobiota bacterium]